MDIKTEIRSLIPKSFDGIAEKYNSEVRTVDYSNLSITRIGHMAEQPNQYFSSWYERHDYCIQYVVKGKGKYFVNNHLYSLSPNTLFMLPLGKKYHFYTSDKQDPYEYYWIHCNGEGFKNFLKSIGLSEETPVIFNVQNPNIRLSFVKLIENSKNKETASNALLLLANTYQLLYEIVEGIPFSEKFKPNSLNNGMESVIDYINRNYQAKITLETLAEFSHINKYSLVDQFKKTTGMTPIQYLIQYRISKACQMLHTNANINDICYSCGFQELTSFLIRFKKITGYTPSQYRRSLKSNFASDESEAAILSQKKFIFTIDDNIRFLKELTENNAGSLFAHPYAKMLKELHEKYDVKIQLNLFYHDAFFELSQMTDKYLSEWAENADWLKLSFHSKLENVLPYQNADYAEVSRDCQAVQKEILRFAGKNSLATTTTIHYCQTTEEGLLALKDCGVKGLLGLYGTSEKPRSSYFSPDSDCEKIRNGETVLSNGIAFRGIDIVLNSFDFSQILAQLQDLQKRKIVNIMIHEQYFYKDYTAYQADFRKKLERTLDFLRSNGFASCFFEELL